VEAQERQAARWWFVAATLFVVAACLVGSVIAGSVSAGSDDGTQTYEGPIDAATPAGASAELEVGDDGAVLVTVEPHDGSDDPSESPVITIPRLS
jgi:hypothetical protein